MDSSKLRRFRIFCSYAHEDKELVEALVRHIGKGHDHIVLVWYDGMIGPGKDWSEEIQQNLDAADIILLMVSDHFLASEYCYEKEMPRAMERSKAQKIPVVPIILSPTYWKHTKFAALQALPAGALPITQWDDRKGVLANIAGQLHDMIDEMSRKFYVADARLYLEAGEVEGAQEICETVLRNSYPEVTLNEEVGDIFRDLGCLDQALVAYDKAIVLSKSYEKKIQLYLSKGEILFQLSQYEDALVVYENALKLDGNNSILHEKIGDVQDRLGNSAATLEAYEQAIKLCSSEVKRADLRENKADVFIRHIKEDIKESMNMVLEVYNDAIKYILEDETKESVLRKKELLRNKGTRLAELGQSEEVQEAYIEALDAYNDAIKLDPLNPFLYKERGDIHYGLHYLADAIADYEKAVSLLTDFEAPARKVLEHLEKEISVYMSRHKKKNEE